MINKVDYDLAKDIVARPIIMLSDKENFSNRNIYKSLENTVDTFVIHDPGFYDLYDKNRDKYVKSISNQRKLEITIDELTKKGKKKSAH